MHERKIKSDVHFTRSIVRNVFHFHLSSILTFAMNNTEMNLTKDTVTFLYVPNTKNVFDDATTKETRLVVETFFFAGLSTLMCLTDDV